MESVLIVQIEQHTTQIQRNIAFKNLIFITREKVYWLELVEQLATV
jgi:hypothetical protein